MAYSLDFHGRVTLPSNKNFILNMPVQEGSSETKLCLQFGKTEDFMQEIYTCGAFVVLAFPKLTFHDRRGVPLLHPASRGSGAQCV